MATGRGVKAGDAFIIIGAMDKTGRVLQQVQRRFQQLGSTLRNIGLGLTTASVALTLPLANGVQTFAEFDDSMKRVEARSRGTVQEMKALTTQAKELGRQTVFTASAIANMQAKLAISGFNRGEILNMTKPLQALARAIGDGEPQEDLRIAADLVGTIINGFNDLDSGDTARVTNVLAAAASESKLNLEGLKDGLKFIGPLASDTGMSIEEVASVIGMLSNVSIEAGIGGRSLRRTLLGLVDEETVKKFNDIVGELTNKQVVVAGRKMHEILFDIGEVLKDLSPFQRLDIIGDLVGKEAATGATKLAFGLGEYNEIMSEVQKAHRENRAEKMQAKMNESLKASFMLLQAAVEGVKIALGEALKGSIENVLGAILPMLDELARWIEQNEKIVKQVVLAIGAVGAFGIAITGLGLALHILAPIFGMLAGAISGAIALFGFMITPIGAVITALAALMIATGKTGKVWDWFKDLIQDNVKIDFDTSTLEAFKDDLGLLADMFMSGDIDLAFDTMILMIQEKWIKLTDWMQKRLEAALDPTKALKHIANPFQKMFDKFTGMDNAKKALDFLGMEKEAGKAHLAGLSDSERTDLAEGMKTLMNSAEIFSDTTRELFDKVVPANLPTPPGYSVGEGRGRREFFQKWIAALDRSVLSTENKTIKTREKAEKQLSDLREKIEKNKAEFERREGVRTFQEWQAESDELMSELRTNTEEVARDSQIIDAQESAGSQISPLVAKGISAYSVEGIQQAMRNSRIQELARKEKENNELLQETKKQTEVIQDASNDLQQQFEQLYREWKVR